MTSSFLSLVVEHMAMATVVEGLEATSVCEARSFLSLAVAQWRELWWSKALSQSYECLRKWCCF
jgi:AmiR/NasT family two-component response regulator